MEAGAGGSEGASLQEHDEKSPGWISTAREGGREGEGGGGREGKATERGGEESGRPGGPMMWSKPEEAADRPGDWRANK